MRPLGPWAENRAVAVAVSGGADSLALALLVRRWSDNLLALIVDHGLRPSSAAEAMQTRDTLTRLGIPARILTLHLAPGTRLQERARHARHAALAEACNEAGFLDLLLGHHATDQDETIRMRARAGSGPAGLAGMSALSERPHLRLVRPLLPLRPERLRATLHDAGVSWIDDPSNHNPRFERARQRADPNPASHQAPPHDRTPDAEWLARHVAIHEAGFALLPPGPIPPGALSRTLQVISGREHPPPRAAIARLASDPGPATLHGVRLLPAGRFGPGLIACREPASLGAPIAAEPGVTWDRRYRLRAPAFPTGWTFGPLATTPNNVPAELPTAILPTLPAIRDDAGRLRAVPHLGIPNDDDEIRVIFSPNLPIAPSFFMPLRHGCLPSACLPPGGHTPY